MGQYGGLWRVLEPINLGHLVVIIPSCLKSSLSCVSKSRYDLFQVNSVRLPRHVADKRLFCGTALVEFSTQEEAEKILGQNLVYGGVQLELKSK